MPLRLGGGSALCLSPDFWWFAGNFHFLGLEQNHPSHCLPLIWHSPCVCFFLCVPISSFYKVCIVKAIVFLVVIYRCDSWTIKKAED